MVNQVVVNWNGPGHTPKQSVLHFSGGVLSGAWASINAMLDLLMPLVSTEYTAQLATEYKILDTATGTLTGVGGVSSRPLKTGTSAGGEMVADATMGLMRFQTDGIVAGKRVRGRLFVPGITVDHLENGNLVPSSVTTLAFAAASLAAGSQMVIWARPLKDPASGAVLRPGTTHDISGGTAWDELAVLRRRRG